MYRECERYELNSSGALGLSTQIVGREGIKEEEKQTYLITY